MRLMPMLILSVIALGWLETLHADPRCPEKKAAKLVSLQGKVFVDTEGSGRWQLAQLNDRFCERSRIRVAAYSRASIQLPDAIILRLDEGTVLSLDEIAPDKTKLLQMLKGFMHFISRTPKQLQVNTPISNAGPEGTEFAFSVDETKAGLWVYEGGVKFFNNKGSLHLKPGQSAQTYKGQAPQAQIDIKPQDAVNWALYYPPILPYPDSATVIDSDLRLAIDEFRRGQMDVALSHLDAFAVDKQKPYFFKVRAAMRLTVGLDQLALQDIQALLAKKPKDAEALALQSIRSLTQNRKDEAYALANKAVAADAKSATAYSALSYAEQGRFELEKALQAAKQATKYAPHDAMVWARKAELELALGFTPESQQTAERAAGLDAVLERTQTVLGFSHLLRMDTDEAVQRFEKAISLDSTSPLPRLGLGLAKIRRGDLEAGRQDLEIAAILDPNNSLIRSYLGKAYYEEKRNSLAEDQFNLAKLRDAKDPTPYFYDAIRKQTINRPVEALQDMQKAIELNDNRAVFRSKLMLDKDVAAREAGLGRIFNGLGFDDVANRQAMKALATDPSNYSAHRLLSDSYATKPRQEIARSSEYLQSLLLQPLNYNPIQPSLAYTDLNIIKGIGPNDTAFNEYNRLFERNGIRFTTTGIAGSNNTFGDESALSGIHNKFSYSLGQLHYETNGFRKNNDLKNNLYNVFTQYEISPSINIQAEYRHRETEHGDLELKGQGFMADEQYFRKLKQNSYRLGLKVSPAKHSDLLFSFIYSDRQELKNQANGTANASLNDKGYNLETQYIFHNEYFNTVIGGAAYLKASMSEITSSAEVCKLAKICGSSSFNTNQYTGYLYTNANLYERINLTAGLSYDFYKQDHTIFKVNLSEINPKLGLTWKINDHINLRTAGFKTVKPSIFVNQFLQPIQTAGFNQFFDDPGGTVAWQYGIGADAKIQTNIYLGFEVFKRDLKMPFQNTYVKKREELYRFYLNWMLGQNWVINSEYRFENYHSLETNLPLKFVETSYLPVSLRFFNDVGFFSELKGTWINQRVGYSDFKNFQNSFILVDAALGYRLPKSYGLFSLEVKNLLNEHFEFRDRQFQMNEQRAPDIMPERTFFARITLNF